MITRWQLALGAVALGALGAVGAFEGLTPHGGRAQAQAVSVLELEAQGPLQDIVMGKPNAPVTIIEYASMTCPHCAHFATETFPKLKEKYIDTGKVRYIMREYPLDQLALAAFMLARCAGPDKYYPMIETLFAEQDKWRVRDIQPLLGIARQAGFTEESAKACIGDKELFDKIKQTRDRGSQKFKVEATPTFYINGERFSGALSMDELDKAITPLLPKAEDGAQMAAPEPPKDAPSPAKQ